MERGVGSVSLGKISRNGSSGGTLVWSRDMGDFGTNNAEVRGSECEFPVTGRMITGNAVEG